MATSLAASFLAFAPRVPPPRAAAPSSSAPLDPPLPVWQKQAAAMWVSAAALGPLCDSRHSAHNVLHYATDSIAGAPFLLRGADGAAIFETHWWVPIAFGGAGVILGAAHLALDRAWGGGPRPPPGWPAVLLSISCFVLCYELSGVLAQAAVASGAPREIGQLDVPLLVNAAAIFLIFERSWGGLFMMVLLATIGPAVETQLIGALHLYAYSDPDVAGIPTWIAWVYAAGGPPNGALGRQILHELNLKEQMKS